jgi:hypothetical protein
MIQVDKVKGRKRMLEGETYDEIKASWKSCTELRTTSVSASPNSAE